MATWKAFLIGGGIIERREFSHNKKQYIYDTCVWHDFCAYNSSRFPKSFSYFCGGEAVGYGSVTNTSQVLHI